MLPREDFGGRHERNLKAVLNRHERRQERDDRLAGADISLQKAVHRLGALQVVDDLSDGLALSRRQLERQDPGSGRADPVVDLRNEWLELRARRVSPPCMSNLIQEELLEDQPALRRRAKRIQLVERRLIGRKVSLLDRLSP